MLFAMWQRFLPNREHFCSLNSITFCIYGCRIYYTWCICEDIYLHVLQGICYESRHFLYTFWLFIYERVPYFFVIFTCGLIPRNVRLPRIPYNDFNRIIVILTEIRMDHILLSFTSAQSRLDIFYQSFRFLTKILKYSCLFHQVFRLVIFTKLLLFPLLII